MLSFTGRPKVNGYSRLFIIFNGSMTAFKLGDIVLQCFQEFFSVLRGEYHPTLHFSLRSSWPGAPKAKVKSRVILTPQHAKKFLKALQDNVTKFESSHGTIKDYEQPGIPINFGPAGEA